MNFCNYFIKSIILAILLFLSICCFVVTSPLKDETLATVTTTTDDWDFFEKFEQIIYVPSRDEEASLSNRNLYTDWRYLWPNAQVPYEFSGMSVSQAYKVREAMTHIERRTCVRWIKRQSHHTQYLEIRTGAKGCWANLGHYTSVSKHEMHLQDDSQGSCMTLGIIVHELLHVLGFFHEHSRGDRNDHVTINWSNIPWNKKTNFIKHRYVNESQLQLCEDRLPSDPVGKSFDHCYSGYTTDIYSGEYDFNSIMHYSLNSFGKDKSIKTIIPKNSSITSSGNRDAMSELDIIKVQKAYKCGNYSYTDNSGASIIELRIIKYLFIFNILITTKIFRIFYY